MPKDGEKAQCRRNVLKNIGAAGTVGVASLAGCTGLPGENDNDEFSPESGIVEHITGVSAGGGGDQAMRAYGDGMADLWPSDVDTTFTNETGADGMIALRSLYNGPDDGGLIGHFTTNVINDTHMEGDDFNQEDIHFLGGKNLQFRTFLVSHHGRDLEQHFEWEWDDLVASAQEDPLACAVVGPDQYLLPKILFEGEDRLSEDDYTFINFPGGPEARDAIAAGDVDIFVTSLTHAFAAEYSDFYKAMWVLADRNLVPQDIQAAYEELESYDGDQVGVPTEAWATEAPGMPDTVDLASNIAINSYTAVAPPDTPDNILEIQRDVFEEASEDPDVQDRMGDAFDPVDVAYVPPEDVSQIASDRVQTMEENDLVQEILEEQN